MEHWNKQQQNGISTPFITICYLNSFIWMKAAYEVNYTTTVYQIPENIYFYGGMLPWIPHISSWYNGTFYYNCSWFCSKRDLKILWSAFICYATASQLQPTGGSHNFLRTYLGATHFYTYIKKGEGQILEFTWMLLFTNNKLH